MPQQQPVTPAPRILIVKTSSMGDVVHATPVVADILAHFCLLG